MGQDGLVVLRLLVVVVWSQHAKHLNLSHCEVVSTSECVVAMACGVLVGVRKASAAAVCGCTVVSHPDVIHSKDWTITCTIAS